MGSRSEAMLGPSPEPFPSSSSSSPNDSCHPRIKNSAFPEQEDDDERKRKEKREKFMAFMRQEKPLFGLSQLTVSRWFFWINHVLAVYGLYFLLTGHYSWGLLLFHFTYSYMGALGTTVGAHRYWTHKCFKAKLPLQILLMFMQTITGQYSIYKWCLDHRIHHKYTDTNKDPHNSKRGFWFSHMFWVLSPKHPEHAEKLRTFDMPDLEKDPVVLFQSRYYNWLLHFSYNVLPATVSTYFFGISLGQAECLNCLRWVYNTHISAAVNSFAHIWGCKPYHKDITSTDNRLVALVSVGEGWHNYHHTFPWDYKASELGWKINISTMFIDFFAWIGWAYDMKVVSQEMLKAKVEKSGDGSHPQFGKANNNNQERGPLNTVWEENMSLSTAFEGCETTTTWGWGDECISDEFKKLTSILNPLSMS